jgi:fructose-bisphosphate aldolase class II
MTLAKMMDVLQPAMEDGYAVGAFNADNLEMVQAFVQAAVAERSPLILQVSQGAIQYSGMGHVTQLCRFVAQEVDIPIVVHLDHGKDYVQNIRALKAGVTCLGVDASMLPYDENIAVTRKVAQMAHHAGLHAEGGVGYVPAHSESLSAGEVEMAKTDPDQAYEFVQQTGVDLLAVALGSMRGMRQREIALDIERLKAIRERVSIPFVLHGSSGVHWESIQDAIREGVCKVNLAACFDRRLVEVMRELLDKNPEEFNFRKIIGPAREQVRELAREQYRLLGSNGRV